MDVKPIKKAYNDYKHDYINKKYAIKNEFNALNETAKTDELRTKLKIHFDKEFLLNDKKYAPTIARLKKVVDALDFLKLYNQPLLIDDLRNRDSPLINLYRGE